MGLFTHVKPARSVLPEKYRHLTRWQTKDVVSSNMETLEITEDGRLIHIQHNWRLVEDTSRPLDYRFKSGDEFRNALDFHGDMCFYTGSIEDPNDDGWYLVELVARFTDGKLQSIRDMSNPDWSSEIVEK